MIWFLFACKSEVAEIPVTCQDSITYQTVGEPFLRNYCTGCHASKLPAGERYGAPASVNLDTYEDARQWAVRSYVRAVHFQTMPPSGGISENERARFKQWALCGAKGQETETPEIESAERPYSRAISTNISTSDGISFTLKRFMVDYDLVVTDQTLIREEYYRLVEDNALFDGYDEWSDDGELLSSVRLSPGLPLSPDNWVDRLDIQVSVWLDGEEWPENQEWMSIQGFQSLNEIDVHERDPNPLLTLWWNAQGEEWGWHTSETKILSGAYGTTVRGLEWEAQQFLGPEIHDSTISFPLAGETGWIDLWIEWEL